MVSDKLLQAVQNYIDKWYLPDEAFIEDGSDFNELLCKCQLPEEYIQCNMPVSMGADSYLESLENLLEETDAGFSETLLKLIDKTGKKDSDIYKKANIDRKLFSKIRNNPDYKPSKTTAIAFAIALELNLDETRDFIARAGFALSHSSKFDIIIEYFISNRNYNMFEINETLFAFDQSLLGA